MSVQGRAQPMPSESDAAESSAGDSPANLSDPTKSILDLDIEQLARTPVVVPSMDIPVTSVTKEQSTVGRSAAAVFVITNEMIRRSGATCIPEALRMAPGMDVARINSNTWAISSRGFNSPNANKLLVLIDGRAVYSPVFSGVYWDVQDVVLEDIERIEVIRGPGGTLWGANAVNGVINIITKPSGDTQGAYVQLGGGTVERSNETVRYGGQIGEDSYYRVYGKYFDRSAFYDPAQPANDGWNQGRFGFRTDWALDEMNSLTVQGDHYLGTSGNNAFRSLTVPPYYVPLEGATHNNGENVLARYRRVIDDDSDWTLQSYLDRYERNSAIFVSQRINTFDIEFQYRFPLGDRHQITCGAGYRYIHTFCPSPDPFTASFRPENRNLYIANQFIQDEIALVPDQLDLIMGCKLEQNSYTYFEYQPTIRMLYTPDRRHTLWGAVSRAVRTPSRVDDDVFITTPPTSGPAFMRVLGNRDFRSETLIAYELGYRTQATERFSWDIATVYNVYGSLGGVNRYPYQVEFDPPPPHLIAPVVFENNITADTYGVELSTNWTVSQQWRLSAQYTFLRMVPRNDVGLEISTEGRSPRHQVYMTSSWNLREDLDFDLTVRYVDALAALSVPSYITMDMRLAWRPRKHIELAVVGQNLLQTYHYEFGPTTEGLGGEVTEVPRGVYGTAAWRF